MRREMRERPVMRVRAGNPLARGGPGDQGQVMGFFDDATPPGPDEPHPRDHPWNPPRAELAKVGASSLLLARTEVVAVAVTAVWAYREGFEFWVGAQFRRQGLALQDTADGESLHLGVQFADGRKVVNVGRLPDHAGSEAAGLILSPRSFGAGRWQKNRTYWVWPLPPPGPLTFVCEWAAFGIPESRAEVDAQLIRDAAAGSIPLWPGTSA
jgi:hypothetical protein